MNDIEVKRARVRALAWKLISNPPLGFDLQECCSCAIAAACRMPEFELIGWKMGEQWTHGYLLSNRPLIDGRFAHEAIKHAASILGLEEWHVGYSYKGDDSPILDASAFHVGVTYLEAIGDCGPPERTPLAYAAGTPSVAADRAVTA